MHALPLEARRGCQDSLDLELQAILSSYVDTGNQTQVLCQTSQCSD